MKSYLSTSAFIALVALSVGPAAAQEQPGIGIQPKGPKETGKSGPRIKIGSDPEPAAPAEQPRTETSGKPAKSEPEQLVEELAQWPAADAKQASIRLASQPTVAYPLLERKMLEPNQDWRMICGAAATLGKIRDLRALELIRAKIDDRKMYTHASDLLDALVRIDPVSAKATLLALLLHPASTVVVDVEKLLVPRVAATDLDKLRDVFDAGGGSARAAALRLMTKADRVATRSDLVKALRDKEPDVAFAAASALAGDEAPEALDLTIKSTVTPVDRQFAYATISLALRTERGGPRIVDDSTVRYLIGGRGLKSLDQLSRACAALLLADEGYYHEVAPLADALDKEVLPALVEAWTSRDFWPDMKILQPLILARLNRLAGHPDVSTPQEWSAWWQEHGTRFQAKRVLLDLPDDVATSMILTVDGTGAPGGEATTITASTDPLGVQGSDDLALLITADEAKELAATVNASGVLRAAEGIGSPREMPNWAGFTIRAGKRERRASVRTDAPDAGVEKLLAAVTKLREQYSWQRYRTSANGLDAQSFVAAMSKSFSAERTPDERAASLASMIVMALDDRRGVDWNVRALKELESVPRLSAALGAAETDRLLSNLGRRKSLDFVAQGIVRVLAKAKKPEATPLVVDFLVTRSSPDSRGLLVEVLKDGSRDQFLAALSDERSEVRLAAFAAVDRETADDAVVARISKAVDDKDRGVASEAVRSLGRLRVEKARPLVVSLAENPGELRPAAVEALGMLGGKESLGTIMTAYTSDDASLRVAAVLALASSREPEGLPAIVFAMNGDPSNLVRAVAARAIVDMGTDRAAAELRKLAVDPAQQAGPRAQAISGFAKLRGKAATVDLAKLLEDPSDEVADAAAVALARWREPDAVPHLISMLEKERSAQTARQALESISLESFGQRDPKLLADLYGGWWELSRERGPKRWLLDAITLTTGEDAKLRAWAEGDSGRQVVPSLLPALRSDKWYVRRAADLALRDLLGKKVDEQDPWTTQGDVTRIAEAWEKIWGESLGN